VTVFVLMANRAEMIGALCTLSARPVMGAGRAQTLGDGAGEAEPAGLALVVQAVGALCSNLSISSALTAADDSY